MGLLHDLRYGKGSFLAASAAVALAIAAPLAAEVRLPHGFGDHAVLQRDAPIHIWGWSDPREHITVQFHAQTRQTAANEYGEWSLWLAPESAGGPYTMSVKGEGSGEASGAPVSFSDLLVGDVWFASGQSNMEFPLRGFPGNAVLKDGDKETANATLPQVRLLRIDHKASNSPLDDVGGAWTTCTPQTAAEFSAVAYFFGREIQQKEHVPIGLIDSTWGGTPIEAWTSLDALSADSSLMPVFASWAHFADQQARLPLVIAEEKREDAAAAQAQQPKPAHPWRPAPESWQPAALFNGMIAPLTPYSIKGVIWYQGETNSAPERAPLYEKLFAAMIAGWRSSWQQGQFPFLFAQISSFNSPGESWGLLRDQQRRTLSVAGTAMAVTLDVGDPGNVHPSDKQTVGARLALAALATVYGKQLEFSGPLFRQAVRENGGMRVYFDHAAGLRAHGDSLIGFELAGPDRKFYPAKAVIGAASGISSGNGSVVVTSERVSDPVYVRYAWPGATTANLYNSADLPASTFTSE
ncbi:MAG TPA: sialate O-acetylesterase [Granulicella sp.]|jgi:sialate O-acetylesterase|nr:sialate O-acetylesterase [Granulicella sp.]